jgi:hypothetical protein
MNLFSIPRRKSDKVALGISRRGKSLKNNHERFKSRVEIVGSVLKSMNFSKTPILIFKASEVSDIFRVGSNSEGEGIASAGFDSPVTMPAESLFVLRF